MVAAAAAPSVGMSPMLQQTSLLQQTSVLPASSLTAGTPIILGPRIPTPQLANVTSLTSQAILAAAGTHTPSVVTPANATSVPTSGLVYSYDPAYLQRMLDYPTAVDASSIGKHLLVSLDVLLKCGLKIETDSLCSLVDIIRLYCYVSPV